MEKEVAYPLLAKNKFIEGDWTPVPPVTVPFDVNWYVTDERGSDRERLNVQIQKWVDIAHPDPTNQRADVAVADWSVLEKSPAATCYRGDYIGRKDFVEIPTWSTLREEWEFARGPKRTIGKKISEDFTVKLTPGVDPTLLVDYDGGKQSAKIGDKSVADECAVRVLFMTGDGKLEIRTNQEDINDQERKDRYETWKKRLEDVKNPKRKGPDKMFEGGKGPAQ
jgi:hypothetical protein